jgi:hypothetical protein
MSIFLNPICFMSSSLPRKNRGLLIEMHLLKDPDGICLSIGQKIDSQPEGLINNMLCKIELSKPSHKVLVALYKCCEALYSLPF